MQTLAQIKHILEERGLRPKRSLGQNFLIDHNLIRKLVDASGVVSGDLVLEVGPGTGALTEELLARRCRVIACELDDSLADLLRERIPNLPGGEHFSLIHADCLADKRRLAPQILEALGERPFALVANLPYGAATPLLSTLFIHHPQCLTMAVTVQKEVVDRLMAKSNSKDFGPLGVIAQSLTDITKIATAPPECFWPRPEVTSAMVLLTRRTSPLTADPIALSEFCKVLFAHRRKQIGSTLGKTIDWARVAGLPGCEGIGPSLRAEQLTCEQIVTLAGTFTLPRT